MANKLLIPHNGEYIEIGANHYDNITNDMSSVLVEENKGKFYLYTGATDTTWKKWHVYHVIMEQAGSETVVSYEDYGFIGGSVEEWTFTLKDGTTVKKNVVLGEV